jgi:hypothetical protein
MRAGFFITGHDKGTANPNFGDWFFYGKRKS